VKCSDSIVIIIFNYIMFSYTTIIHVIVTLHRYTERALRTPHQSHAHLTCVRQTATGIIEQEAASVLLGTSLQAPDQRQNALVCILRISLYTRQLATIERLRTTVKEYLVKFSVSVLNYVVYQFNYKATTSS